MAFSLVDALNALNNQGFFSYIIPFLLIFALVFAILEKTKLFAKKKSTSTGADGKSTHEYEDNKSVSAIIAVAVGLLALQFDMVSIFFANIFPKFGVGLAVFLVLLIFLGFFYDVKDNAIKWIGWVTGIGVALWALTSWGTLGQGQDIGYFIQEYFWAAAILGGLIWLIYSLVKD